MQNTFSQSGNDSKWVLTKFFFQNRYVAHETPSRPPPFLANTILNFHFDYWNPSLIIFLAILILLNSVLIFFVSLSSSTEANLTFFIWLDTALGLTRWARCRKSTLDLDLVFRQFLKRQGASSTVNMDH